jgi:hypothetical protein
VHPVENAGLAAKHRETMANSVKIIPLNVTGWGGRRTAEDVPPERASVPPEDQALLDAYSRALIDVVDPVGPAVVGLAAHGGEAPVVLPPINEVIDLHSMHFAMARRHLPVPIMAVLLGTAAIGVSMIGFGNGRVGRRFSVLDTVYGAVLALALWMTIDLDYPGIGLIRVSNLPVVETLAAMN